MPERGEQAVAAIGANARFVRTDMADAESVRALVGQCGDVDIVVNNAATLPRRDDCRPGSVGLRGRVRHQRPRRLLPDRRPGAGNAGAGSRQHRQRHHSGRVQGSPRCVRIQRIQGGTRSADPHVGRRVRITTGCASTASRPAPPAPRGWPRNGAKPTRNSAGHCRWAAPRIRRRSPRPCCSSRPPAPVSSPARPLHVDGGGSAV